MFDMASDPAKSPEGWAFSGQLALAAIGCRRHDVTPGVEPVGRNATNGSESLYCPRTALRECNNAAWAALDQKPEGVLVGCTE